MSDSPIPLYSERLSEKTKEELISWFRIHGVNYLEMLLIRDGIRYELCISAKKIEE